ncbi:MAG: 4Fe-4S binding protein [Dehalococcoidia bacterium]|nr:4Fe-4S binding protein [Dehalococcoidia bacterium]
MAARKRSRRWRWVRLSVQTLALALFLYLLVAAHAGASTWLPGDLFFRLDPLTGLAAMLAEKRLVIPMLLGLLTVGLTILLGRAWCSWVCPMGTLVDWINVRRFRNALGHPSPWHLVKHVTLLAVLLGALLGTLSLLILDPITILFRMLTSGFIPGIDWMVTRSETYFYRYDAFQGFLERFDGFVRGTLLPAAEPYFIPSIALIVVFMGILALNAVRPRFWCRYVCPLGALLGLVSHVSVLRRVVDREKCNSCRRCARECPVNAIDSEKAYASDPAECIMCLKCVEDCPTGAITIRPQPQLARPELEGLTRRQVLGSFGLMLAGIVVLRLAPLLRGTDQRRLRPPGSSEQDMMTSCIRCGICVNICPTHALHPGGAGADYDGLWTPMLVPRLGYCDYMCTSCGEACPTGAIPMLSLTEKQQAVIGKAEIDQDRCVPWSQGVNCIVCQEMCPVPEKAIELEEVIRTNSEGLETTVLLPLVVRERCIGCGLCEHQCPVNGEAAIRVYPDQGGGQRQRRGRS